MNGIVFTGEPMVRDDIGLRSAEPREILVRIVNAGLCHSDISVLDGTIPCPTPMVMGHEGAGVVEAIGSAVTAVAVGDHVVLTTLGNCGQCDACDRGLPTFCRRSVGGGAGLGRFTAGRESAFQFANVGAFAERTLVWETQCVVIDPGVPLESACLIGCAVLTGVGAVLNRARVEPGETVVVIGAGGIGQSVIQGARLASASRIVAIDSNPGKEEAALQMGATDFIDATSTDNLVAALHEVGLTNGADYVFECVGRPDLIRLATEMLDWGGVCVMLGVPRIGSEASFVVSNMYNDKSIFGCRYGSARPHHDIQRIVAFYKAGKLLLDEMVGQVYAASDFDLAVADAKVGSHNRTVLRLDG
jgi:S-(hydroxymethyl)glutathione dehydrogenase/alcohol dehydrogenase